MSAPVRVGIVSWNTAALLDECLAALPAALAGREATVVVVDNASGDDSVAVARRHGATVVANVDNVGYARAMNQALAGPEPIAIALNPDTVAAPGSLARLVAELEAHPEVGLAVPRLRNADGTHQPSCYRLPSVPAALAVAAPPRWHHGAWGRHWWLDGAVATHERSGDVGWAIGAVHALRREALGAAPPYDERTFMYAEDIDLCWRLADGGWRRRLVADATVRHVGNAAGAQAFGTQRASRWLDATLDLLERRRGRRRTRAWLVANLVALRAQEGWARLRGRGPVPAAEELRAPLRRALREGRAGGAVAGRESALRS